MEMLIVIFVCVAALIAVMDSVAEEDCADHNEHEPARTHNGMVGAQRGERDDESWLMSSSVDAAWAWGTELEKDLLSTSRANENSSWLATERTHWHVVNPANGLPMTSNSESGVDVMGNPYGTDFHRDLTDYFGGGGSWIDSWSSGSAGQIGSIGGCDDWP